MFIFKILLIILIAAPVIALALYFYLQMLSFIREKDRREAERYERERLAAEAGYCTGGRSKRKKTVKKAEKKGKRKNKKDEKQK